jgi:hypothetical protein
MKGPFLPFFGRKGPFIAFPVSRSPPYVAIWRGRRSRAAGGEHDYEDGKHGYAGGEHGYGSGA